MGFLSPAAGALLLLRKQKTLIRSVSLLLDLTRHPSLKSATIGGQANMSLWDDACASFVQQLREKREDPVAIESFLQDKASLDDVRQSVTSLQNDSDRKYGSSESSGKGISAKWIRRIMENLDKFLTFGDVAMTAAPESIGLAWFVIKNALGAIQNDYKLYELFNAGLKDITDMMVLVRTYDNIYKGYAIKASGSILEELSKSILEAYVSILDFSYAVRKHITGGKRSKLVHALKDTAGVLNREFDDKTAAIQAQKMKIVQYSEAAFQQKTTDKLGNMSGELVSIQRTMGEVFEFQQQSSKEQKEILSELKASRSPSHREIAVAEYEKNMQRLTPWLEGSARTMSIHIKERENGTCAWIAELPAYAAWLHSEASAILCVVGEPNSGKSVLGTYVCEKLRNEADDDIQPVIHYISADTGTNDDIYDTLRFETTLLRTIYEHALDDTGDDILLQRCNRLILHPKQRKIQESSGRSKQYGRPAGSQNAGGDSALDIWDVSSGLIEMLQKRFVLVLDALDGFSDDEQVQLAKHLVDLKNETSIHIRILLLCRPTSQVRSQLADEDVAQISITDYNEGDIKLVIEKGLETVPGISSTEKTEIEDAILEKTGHQIRYVEQVALPFLRTPLRRPISKWLTDLPENVNETYHRHLLQLAPDYRRLLHTALSWTLTARSLPRVEEIMEAYSGAYLHSSTNDGQNRTDENLSLYCEQIQKAAGPFLEVRDNRYVVLGDAQAVRSFCKPEPDKPDGDLEGPICAKCKNAIQIGDRFTISERQEHLEMAITCCKSLARDIYLG